MIDLSNVKGLADDVKGAIKQIADAAGNVLWKAAPSEATVTITGQGWAISKTSPHAYAEIDGVTYSEAATLSVPIGTVIKCKVIYSDYSVFASGVYLNGTRVATNEVYEYTVTGDIQIRLRVGAYNMGSFLGGVDITEL